MWHKSMMGKVVVSVTISVALILSVNIPVPVSYAESGTKVFGFVHTEVGSIKQGIKIELGSGLSTVTDDRGYFELTGVPAGTYTLAASKTGFIRRSVAVYASNDVMVSSPDFPVKLWAGDYNQDRSVNMADVFEISRSFNTAAGDNFFNPDYDLNRDEVINMKEVMLIAGNFGKTFSDYYIDSASQNEITPKEIREEVDCRIFKLTSNYESYVLIDDEFIYIGKGFGGFGVYDIKTCDFDGDGRKELIYAFSFGSGLHRSHIGILNLQDKKETVLDFMYTDLGGDITLKKISDKCFEVYDRGVNDKLIARVGMVEGKIAVERVN